MYEHLPRQVDYTKAHMNQTDIPGMLLDSSESSGGISENISQR